MMLGINGDGIDILVLESLNQTAAGAYECRVGNELGEAVSNTLLVDVLCKLYILLYFYTKFIQVTSSIPIDALGEPYIQLL